MLSKILAAWCGFWGGVVATLLLLALLLSSCAGSRPAPAAVVPPVVAPDSLVGRDVALLAQLPPYLVPAPVGSSPRQRRQWQRAQVRNLSRAGVLPAKVKNSSVAAAPGATSINRPASVVATGAGSVVTDARKAGKGHGASAVGPNAVANGSSGPPWWVFLLVAVTGAVGWEWLSAKISPVRALLRWR